MSTIRMTILLSLLLILPALSKATPIPQEIKELRLIPQVELYNNIKPEVLEILPLRQTKQNINGFTLFNNLTEINHKFNVEELMVNCENKTNLQSRPANLGILDVKKPDRIPR